MLDTTIIAAARFAYHEHAHHGHAFAFDKATDAAVVAAGRELTDDELTEIDDFASSPLAVIRVAVNNLAALRRELDAAAYEVLAVAADDIAYGDAPASVLALALAELYDLACTFGLVPRVMHWSEAYGADAATVLADAAAAV